MKKAVLDNGDVVTRECKNDLVVAFNEAKSLAKDLDWIADTDFETDRENLVERARYIAHWLNKYVNDMNTVEDL